jgi:two-component system chemotaxis sensor kinase CheA
MEDLFKKFRKQFIEEIFGLLESSEADLFNLEKDPTDSKLIDSVFRAMHTIKGTSAMYGSIHISDFVHHLENIFQNIRDNKTPVEKEIIDITFESIDHIKCLMNDENFKDEANISRNAALLSKISSYSTSKQIQPSIKPSNVFYEKQPGKQSWYILLRTDDQIYKRGINLVNMFTDLSGLGTFDIHRIAALSNSETEYWGIVLVTTEKINNIKEVFMFIEDNCSFVLLKEGDIKSEEDIEKFAVSKVPQPHVKKTTEEKTSILEEAQKSIPVEPEVVQTPVNHKTAMLVAEASKQNVKRVSVDAVKLDYLMYLVSELITLNSKLLQTTKDEYYENIRPQIEQMEGLTKLFRSNALEIRLVPLGDMVVKFQRLVRDLGKQLGKKVELVTQGTDTELDKNTIDLVSEPIIHIIRNCVDHGIELPAERVKKGKPETGTIKLSARQAGNYINIIIEDDGAGLDIEKIGQKAIEKGIIKSTDNMSKSDICNLIFHSGLSTSQNITNVSGRGVGMDVVKRKIAELRGDVIIDTEKDKGASFLLKIQQSIAIIDTLLFKVEKTYFILPLTDIEICIHIEKSKLIESQNTRTIDYNERMIPYLDLRSYFNLSGSYPNKVRVLILKEGGQYLSLLCDEIIGEQQAVLKPLGESFDNDTGITAVSQHGNGEWAYMLNVHFMHKLLTAEEVYTADGSIQ